MRLHNAITAPILSSCTLALLVIAGFVQPASAEEEAWTFVSSPDLFNADIADLSGGTPGVPKAPGWPEASGGHNGISPQMDAFYDRLVSEMAGHQPEAFIVAGDLLNGRWFNGVTLAMFDPKGRDREVAIDRAAEVYYTWYRQLFARNGIDTVIAAIGDHDVGDNDWSKGSDKARHVITMRRAFGKYMVDPLGELPTINGAAPRPTGTDYEHGAYAFRVRNVLFVSVDVFRQDAPNKKIHYRHGSVAGDLDQAQARWLDRVLSAAGRDGAIDHIIVQGHAPCLPGVRKDSSSGMMMVGRADSPLWQALRKHSHDRGGKVRFYFAGEVHTTTATLDPESDIVQLVHGNPPLGDGEGAYTVFKVYDDRIEAELFRFDLTAEKTEANRYWQPSGKKIQHGASGKGPTTSGGRLVLDCSGRATSIESSGWMKPVDLTKPLVFYTFDSATEDGFSNTGELGDLYYAGLTRGAVTTTQGIRGRAIVLDGKQAFVRSGMLPVSEGEQRTISAWFKTDMGGVGTLLGSGMDRRVTGGTLNLQLSNGVPQAQIGAGMTATADVKQKLNDGAWHHLTLVLPGKHRNELGQVLFYVDGKRVPTASTKPETPINTYAGFQSHLHIGCMNQGGGARFHGQIDEVGFWGVALEPEAIRELATQKEAAAQAD